MDHTHEPVAGRSRRSNGPLVVAVLSSVVATVLVGVTALVAAATSCGFAGGGATTCRGAGHRFSSPWSLLRLRVSRSRPR